MQKKSINLIADFNIEPMAGVLANILDEDYEAISAPYGQVYQTLMQPAEHWASFVFSQPQRVLPSFAKAFSLQEVDEAQILTEVDDFADALINASKDQYVFNASWALPADYSGYNMLDWQPGLGLKYLLAKCNLHLAEKLANHNNIFTLDSDLWIKSQTKPSIAKMWYAAKVPFSPEVFAAAAHDLHASIQGINGKSRRLIVLDLDNTLWGGVVGETGWQGIRLGGHDHVGEAFKDFQTELKALSQRGIQLALASKNDESVALEAIDNHEEMQLKRPDFADWRINWNDKASNIEEMVKEINLGFASVAFIDDNPAERMRVSDALPDILVPEWPQDPAEYVTALRKLNCFHAPSLSSEDRNRKSMYVAQRSRREAQQGVKSSDDWLKKLATTVEVQEINESNLPRVTQLFNKTNQLNLTTRRLSEDEITKFATLENTKMLAVSVSDKFGDMGLVGVISMQAEDDIGHLTDFILSCRVMGRKVEETLIHLAATELQKLGAKTMHVGYLKTERNRPTLEVLENTKLEKLDNHNFTADISGGYEKPEYVTVTYKTNAN